MSNEVTTLVWKNFNRGGSEKLVLLALADWCNDEGESLFPSISGVARKVNLSESRARRIMHQLIDEGFLVVVANHNGGNPHQSRHYKLNVKMLSTPGVDAHTPGVDAHLTPGADAHTPGVDAPYPWRGRALPLAPTPAEPSLTIIEPSIKKNNKKESPDLRGLFGDVSDQTFHDFVLHRKNKKALITETAVNGLRREAGKAGISLETALQECCQRGWVGFKAKWWHKESHAPLVANARFDPVGYVNRGGKTDAEGGGKDGRVIDVE